ncbi:SdpI family protein [Weissella sagaensis]|uniref:SdpI family protein n=1 Tax=Weissella sagaensis TaxID=2559928 RepID=A0ABW1RUN4_9LACO|nr:SdpI family protein [Weissella sagaensis]
MTKKELRRLLIVTTIVMLVPLVVGLMIWAQLPDNIATHFGAGGQANGWHSKSKTVFGLPLLMIVIQYICFFSLYFDPSKNNINIRLFKGLLWIAPIIENIMMFSIYGIALGYSLNIVMIVNFMVGILFITLGNYLHKVKQNYTVGIKIPWTLHSKENWNRTHRFAAWLFLIVGIFMLINGFLQQTWLLIIPILSIVILPIGYSFILYHKGI